MADPGRVVVVDREPHGDHEGSEQLEEQREGEHTLEDPAHVAEVESPGLRLREQARLQPEPPDDHQGETEASVMMPKPPIWISPMITTWPKCVQ